MYSIIYRRRGQSAIVGESLVVHIGSIRMGGRESRSARAVVSLIDVLSFSGIYSTW